MQRRPATFIIGFLGLVFVFAMKANLARALTLMPPVFDYAANPGDMIRGVLRLGNDEAYPITIKPETANFTFKEGDETGGIPQFYPASEDREGRGLASWLNITSESITIPPHSKKNLEFSVTVPANAQPGGHYGAIQLVTAAAGNGGANVGLKSIVSALILVRVNGDVVEDLRSTLFASDRLLYTHLPVDLSVRLENKGTVHLRPAGNIFIKNLFGMDAAVVPVNPEFKSVLPGGARRFDAAWVKKNVDQNASEFMKEWNNFAFGRYTATLALTYGSGNKVISGETAFWVVPWLVLLAFAAGGILTIVLITMILRALRRKR